VGLTGIIAGHDREGDILPSREDLDGGGESLSISRPQAVLTSPAPLNHERHEAGHDCHEPAGDDKPGSVGHQAWEHRPSPGRPGQAGRLVGCQDRGSGSGAGVLTDWLAVVDADLAAGSDRRA
jgi:hypothetical protein